MLTCLTHTEPNYELWIDLKEIIVMERLVHQKSLLIQATDDRDPVTALVLRNGKTLGVKETPAQIRAMMKD